MTRPSRRKKKGGPTSRLNRTVATTSFWERLSETQRHLISISVLVIVALGFFAPANFQGKRIAGSDAIQSRAMAQSIHEYAEETGEIGLWSPNLFSGIPGFLIAYPRVVVQADVVTRSLRRVAFPTFQFLLLVIGVYVLLVILTRQSLPALIAAVAAGLSTYIPIILHAGHNTKFLALSWVPWILIGFLYVLRRPGALSGLGFAAVVALGLRAGHIQITYDAFFFMAIWWAVEAIGAVRNKKTVSFAISTVWLVAGTGLALLMVAQPYLSQFEYKQFSTRGGAGVPLDGAQPVASGSGLAFDYAMSWSQGRLEMLTYLIADAFGGGPDAYWGGKPFTSGPHYLGGIVIALALVAVFGKRSRTTTAIGIVVTVITLFALGKYALWINRPFFYYFPFFDTFRAPEIWLHMVEIGLAILAGIGAAWLAGSSNSGSAKRVGWASFGSLFVLTVILFVTAPGLLTFEKANERERLSLAAARQNNTTPQSPQVQQVVDRYLVQIRTQRIDRFRSDAGRTALFLGIALIGLFIFFNKRLPGSAFLGLLVLLIVIDLWGIGKRYLPSDAYYEGGIERQIPEYEYDRFIKENVKEAGGSGHFRTLSLERSPTNWARPAYHYEIVGGYHAAKLRIYQDLITHLGIGGQGRPPNETMLDLTGTRFIVGREQLPRTTPVFSDQSTGLTVFERPRDRWELRTQLVDSVVVVADGAAVLAELKRPTFDRREIAILLTDPGQLGRIDSTSVAEIELTSYTAHEIEWSVKSDARRLLVSSEIYYPAGWTATVDGEATEILQANHAFRAVIVPAGEHVIRMKFHPESHFIGVRISLFSTIFVYGALVVLIGLHFVRRRRQEAAG